MSVGLHVERGSKTMHEAIIHTVKTSYPGSKCVQIFTHNPMSGKETKLEHKTLNILTETAHIWVHSPYVTNWSKPEQIWAQLDVCDAIGASGLVLHIPKALPPAVVKSVNTFLEKKHKTPIILEMRSLTPAADSYESPAKLVELVKALRDEKIGPNRVGICIDTAHIYAGKTKITTTADAKSYLNGIDSIWEYVLLLHLNGNQYDCDKRAGDKHTPPHSKSDKIWGPGVTWENSGCRIIAEAFLTRGRDIILELDLDDPDTKKIHKLLITK